MADGSKFKHGLLFGAAVAAVLFFILGAVTNETGNRAGSDTDSFTDVACSSDGRTIYVIDVRTVYRSQDGGSNWAVVLEKKSGSF